jgi:hypothetical protein
MECLKIGDEREPVILEVGHSFLALTASPLFLKLFTQLIYQGIDLWDESELTG